MSELAPQSPRHEAYEISSWKQIAIRAGACVLGGFGAAVPLAATYGIEHVSVQDDVGSVPATISVAPGYSGLDTGLAGGWYNRELVSHGRGVKVTLAGPPEVLSSLGTLDEAGLRKTVKPIVGLYQEPSAAFEGYKEVLASAIKSHAVSTELGAGTALSLACLLLSFQGSGHRNEKQQRRHTAVVVGTVALLASSAAFTTHREWLHDNAMPETTYPLPTLAHTKLESTVADNQFLAVVTQRAVPYFKQELKREQRANERFLQTAYDNIDAALARGDFVPPAKNQTTVLALSDIHSNQDMISVYRYLVSAINERYGENTIQLTVFDGDQTYGSPSEKGAIDDMAKISEKEEAIAGNHDGSISLQLMRAAGMDIVDGKLAKTSSGVSVLGSPDPSLTKLKALFGLGDNVSRDGHDITEAEAGAKLLKVAANSKPTFLMQHEAYALQDIIGKDDISQSSMDSWFSEGEATQGQGSDTVPNIPASAVLYGHWHRPFNYRVVWNDDGSWTVVAELGTAGGAIGEMSLTNLSTPLTTPGKQASAVFFTVNNKDQLVQKIQEFKTDTTGVASFEPADSIGSPDGQVSVLAKGSGKLQEGSAASSNRHKVQ
jgi:predicted phosphodiesterase